MNTIPNSKDRTDYLTVINVIENHFNGLCNSIKAPEQKILKGEVPFLIESRPKSDISSQRGLLRLAMVGSPEKTLQGEVFYAIRKEWESQAVLEMKVSEWHRKRRNIDCVVSPNFPNDLQGSTFIELGHYATVQSNPAEVVLTKILGDFRASEDLLNSNLGPILHVMFVMHINKINQNSSVFIQGIRDWPRLPGYFVKGWSKNSKLIGATYKVQEKSLLSNIHEKLKEQLGPYYLGHVTGCEEQVDLGSGNLKAIGQVDRFYSLLQANDWNYFNAKFGVKNEVNCGNESTDH